MGLFFTDELLDIFGTSPLAYTSAGGLSLSEVQAVSAVARDGAFYEAWVAASDRLAEQATRARDDGNFSSARMLFLKTATFYPINSSRATRACDGA